MAIKQIAASGCSEDSIRTAIFEEQKLIKESMEQGIAKQPLYMFSKFRMGRPVNNNENSNIVEKRNSAAGLLPFQPVNNVNPIQPNVEGTMTARDNCGTANITMGAVVNPVDPNQCDKKVGIVDFGHGFFFKGFNDFEIQFATKERCMDDLAAYDPASVFKILRDERKTFINTGIQSLDHHYINYAIANGQANGSVQPVADEPIPILSSGGWHRQPQRHISVSYLEGHADEMARRMIDRNEINLSMMDMIGFEYELTYDAWQLAKTWEMQRRSQPGGMFQDPTIGNNIRITGTLESINKMYFSKGQMKGRGFEKWNDKVTIIFNSYPVRGYLKPNGVTTDGKEMFKFVRIFHLKNVRPEELPYGQQVDGYEDAGLVSVRNNDYYNNFIADSECPGGTGKIVELIPAIKDGAFSVHDRSNLPAPSGMKRWPVNFAVKLVHGDALSNRECPNRFDDIYSLAARNRHRIVNRKTEYAGFIIHLRQFLPLADVPVNEGDFRFNQDPQEPLGTFCEADDPEEYRQCKKCPEEGECTDCITLDPCGDVPYIWMGKEKVAVFKVERGCAEGCEGDPSLLPKATVDYAVSALANEQGNPSVDGEHFCVVDGEKLPIASSGTIEWEAGDDSDKYVCVKIKDALPDIEPEEPNDECCNKNFPTPQKTLINVELSDATGGATVKCAKSVICIDNFAD